MNATAEERYPTEEQIKTVEQMIANPSRSTLASDRELSALTAVLSELRDSRELLEAATEIAFNGEKFMHKIYKAGGQWSDITKDEWHDSALDAYREVKKEKGNG